MLKFSLKEKILFILVPLVVASIALFVTAKEKGLIFTSVESNIIGTWVDESNKGLLSKITFEEDGVCEVNSGFGMMPSEYKVRKNKIYIGAFIFEYKDEHLYLGNDKYIKMR